MIISCLSDYFSNLLFKIEVNNVSSESFVLFASPLLYRGSIIPSDQLDGDVPLLKHNVKQTERHRNKSSKCNKIFI